MHKSNLKIAIHQALAQGCINIVTHIRTVQDSNSYAGIEQMYAKYLIPELNDAWTEIPGHHLGVPGVYSGRKSSRIDVAIGDSKKGPFQSAFELKAVRMPRRNEKGALFDIGQIDVDFRKLALAEIKIGWLVIFVYGPIVDDARTERELFNSFQRQMFVDVNLCSPVQRQDRLDSFEKLGWLTPRASPNQNRFAILHQEQANASIGAICYKI